MPSPISSSGSNQSFTSVTPDPDESDIASVAARVTPAPLEEPDESDVPAPEDASCHSALPTSSSAPAVNEVSAPISKAVLSSSPTPVEQSLYRTRENSAGGEFERGSMGLYRLQNADGSSATVLGLSLGEGEDKDLQITAERSNFSIEHAGYGLSLSGDVGAFRANRGVHNDDGSVGNNIGLTVEAAGLEATVATPIASFTLGASLSAGLAGSSGVRDADGDGKPEFCAKVSVPAFTVGACLERFW